MRKMGFAYPSSSFSLLSAQRQLTQILSPAPFDRSSPQTRLPRLSESDGGQGSQRDEHSVGRWRTLMIWASPILNGIIRIWSVGLANISRAAGWQFEEISPLRKSPQKLSASVRSVRDENSLLITYAVR